MSRFGVLLPLVLGFAAQLLVRAPAFASSMVDTYTGAYLYSHVDASLNVAGSVVTRTDARGLATGWQNTIVWCAASAWSPGAHPRLASDGPEPAATCAGVTGWEAAMSLSDDAQRNGAARASPTWVARPSATRAATRSRSWRHITSGR